MIKVCKKHYLAYLSRVQELEDQGWSIDPWGYAKRTTDNGVLWRQKFQYRSVRIEQQAVMDVLNFNIGEYISRKIWIHMDTVTY